MATTGYVNCGGWMTTANGLCRLWGEVEYYPSRTNNTVTFSSTLARIQYVRESGNWTSMYNNNGWYWKLYIDQNTNRASNSLTGTFTPGMTSNGTATNFSVGVGAGDSTYSAKIGTWFSGDPETFGYLTLSIPTVSAASGQTVSASNIQTTSARLTSSLTSWGNNCTAGTGQRIEYKKSTDSTWTTLAYSTATSHYNDITNLEPGVTYDMRTYEVNGAGLTSNSSTAQFTTLPAGFLTIIGALL